MSNLGAKLKERLFIFISYKGIKRSQFEKICGLSNGYLNNFKGNLGTEKLEDILNNFPELSKDWLLYGEGEMLKTGINQEVNGDHNTAVAGNNNTVNSEELISRLIKLLEKKDEQIAEKDIQMNRLISLLEDRKG